MSGVSAIVALLGCGGGEFWVRIGRLGLGSGSGILPQDRGTRNRVNGENGLVRGGKRGENASVGVG